MTGQIAEGYRLVEGAPSVAEYRHLRSASGLSPVTEAQAAGGRSGGLFAYHVIHEERGIAAGMGRVIGDGGWYFHILDMAVLPDHQRHGLGGSILAALLQRIRTSAPPGAYVNLIADPPGVGLYQRYGFKDAIPELGMYTLLT
ncbi:MAG: hypothetical protein M1818_006618 [Claussenomyces sp. TS43310]|nr:MAG: hypothetical protein M1818_006947 [Claussenomyces sp. TS43310]KAI9735041.1 MAG: hypothetical protein M1818_006618 [Claussenomyces sp. TS43310]